MHTDRIDIDKVISRIEVIWKEHFENLEGPSLGTKLPVGILTKEAMRILRGLLLDVHLLYKIVLAAIREIELHATASDKLEGLKVSILHARQVLEITATLEYLVKYPDLYKEFAWRWDNFKRIHGIKNRMFDLNLPLPPKTRKWIEDNLDHLQAIHKNFSGDVEKDRKIYRKINHWLYPKAIWEIFKEAEKLNLYQHYQWHSHLVHFSPLSDEFYEFQIRNMSYEEVASEIMQHNVHSLYGILLPLTKNRDKTRILRARFFLYFYYYLLRRNQERAVYITEKNKRFQLLAGELIRPDFNLERLILILFGKKQEDPLVVKTTKVNEEKT